MIKFSPLPDAQIKILEDDRQFFQVLPIDEVQRLAEATASCPLCEMGYPLIKGVK